MTVGKASFLAFLYQRNPFGLLQDLFICRRFSYYRLRAVLVLSS